MLRQLLNNPVAALVMTGILALLWFGLAQNEGWWFAALAIPATVLTTFHLTSVHLHAIHPLGLLRFAVFFIVNSLVGGLDVARRALQPGLPLEIYRGSYQLRLPQGQPQTLFIGVVSLLPGTLSVTLAEDRLEVHSIAGEPTAALIRLEQRVAHLFALVLDSGSGRVQR